MSKITQLKLVRKLRPEILNEEFKESTPLTEYECPVCDMPMFLSPGQIMGCHKHCRKEFKATLRNQQKHDATKI